MGERVIGDVTEVARDYPLMLLGLPLVADHEVATYDPVVVRQP
jgi:hypothetical protein